MSALKHKAAAAERNLAARCRRDPVTVQMLADDLHVLVDALTDIDHDVQQLLAALADPTAQSPRLLAYLSTWAPDGRVDELAELLHGVRRRSVQLARAMGQAAPAMAPALRRAG